MSFMAFHKRLKLLTSGIREGSQFESLRIVILVLVIIHVCVFLNLIIPGLVLLNLRTILIVHLVVLFKDSRSIFIKTWFFFLELIVYSD